MKKLILASAMTIAFSSSIATAADVYTKDALTLSVSGEYDVQLGQAIGDDQDVELNYDDLELGLDAKYVINNRLTAFGSLTLNWADQAENGTNDSTVDTAFVGLTIGNISTSIGRQNFGSDDFGIEKAYEFDGGNAFPFGQGSDTVKIEYAASRYNAVLSHDIDEDDLEVTDLFATTKIGSAEVGIAYQKAEFIDTYGVMASLNVGPASIGIDYSKIDINDFETDVTNVAVGFPLQAKLTSAVGATFITPDGSNNDVTAWYANATYNLNDHVSMYGEIGDNDIDNTDLGVVTGMKVTF